MTRTSVTKLDAAARVATLSTKETVGFERALLATGSTSAASRSAAPS